MNKEAANSYQRARNLFSKQESSAFDTHMKSVVHERSNVAVKSSLFHSYDPYLVVADNCDLT